MMFLRQGRWRRFDIYIYISLSLWCWFGLSGFLATILHAVDVMYIFCIIIILVLVVMLDYQ